MPRVTIEDVANALSPQDFMAQHNAATGRVPTRIAPQGQQSLGLNFNDPLPAFGGNSSLQSADPLTLVGLVGQGLTQPRSVPQGDPLVVASEMGLPQYLQEDYKGPETGNRILDALAGFGQVFQGGAGTGHLGAPTALAAQALGDVGDLGSFGGGASLLNLEKRLGPSAANKGFAALADAKIAQESGASMREITGKTGWFKDVDNQWKFEIPNDEAQVTDRLKDLLNEADVGNKPQIAKGTVKDFFRDPRHEYYHPELFDTQTAIAANPGKGNHWSSGSWTPQWEPEPGRPVPAQMLVTGTDEQSMLDTAVHELEHGTQFANAFAPGGSPSYIRDAIKNTTLRDYPEQKQQILDALSNDSRLALMPVTAPGGTSGWESAGGKQRNLWQMLSQNRPTKNEMGQFVQWIESRPPEFQKQLKPLVKPLLSQYMQLAEHPQPEQANDIYLALLGEANARAAALRQPWNMRQRLDNPLFETRLQDPRRSELPGYIQNFDPTVPLDELFK